MAENLEKPYEPAVMALDGAGNSAVAEAGKRMNGALAKVSSSHSSQAPSSPKTECKVLAQKLALQPVPKSKQDQWGLLTAVSEKARKRPQGSHIMLHNSDHVLGRTVAEVSCQFESPAVSGRHCTITRKLTTLDGSVKPSGSEAVPGDHYVVFVKDSSSNGTYINNQRLRKNGPELRVQHGDIISLVAVSEHENALAFVYREVIDDPTRQAPKRKIPPADVDNEGMAGDGKRMRGITTCSSEGPVSLDDVRRLQRSNEELRQQLEDHVLNTEKMRSEMRATEARHQVEVKEVKISVATQYVQQIEEIKRELAKKASDLEECVATCAQHVTTIEDLTQRLAAAAQSRMDAEEAILSHKCSIADLEKRLEEERDQKEKERFQAEANLRAAIERTRAESLEEQKRQHEISARLQKQQQDMIFDLQETDKENRRLAESLRSKLEAERQIVVSAEEKGRRLEVLIQEERFARDSARKKAAELQDELRHVYTDLESEKAARESARAKIESLELEMETAIRDLTLEKQRLQGARERIVLRETQLRAFHSTAAEIEALQQKQQEQLKAMLRTLEDRDEADQKIKKARTEVEDSDTENEDRVESTGRISYLARSAPPSRLDMNPDAGLNPQDSSPVEEEEMDPREEGEGGVVKPTGEGEEWVGDTQEEEDWTSIVPDKISEMAAVVRDSKGTIQDDSGTKVQNSLMDNTQVLDHGQLDATQVLDRVLFPDGGQVLVRETRSKLIQDRWRFDVMDVDKASCDRDDSVDHAVALRDSGSGRDSAQADNDDNEDIEEIGGETMQVDDPVGTAETDNDLQEALEDTLRLHPCTPHQTLRSNSRSAGENLNDQPIDEASTPQLFSAAEETNFEDSNARPGNSQKLGLRNSRLYEETRLESSNKQDNTICTDDLLASEVAGSWAVSHGTPASVHADNESSGSDEGDEYGGAEVHHGIEEGASQVAASTVYGKQPRPGHHIRLEEVLHLAEPVNSQSSLSPATTHTHREERVTLNEALENIEPGLGNLRGALTVMKQPQDDTQDSDDSLSA
ncbi:hypothetical protein MPTK1_1g04060 [Marchantia polymorpha subsp. ruderalis]|uniref:FHA domain-containing protein n=2 Tax=Marchantia polymorpha TaxID=3197 RepID=A0AAF6ALB2_MARPO|nr:hypothetical protein MARPO_0005s0201 [Marchantia polymorpha]BBM97232.1 hypothetical protein Mp_1g04060 [Marchantia polymorpha subsp. ruderalis]|eukprot:PTQ48577.1 hypothetical protein MARPO_0005s0201 [Marchantia polymorpha]